MVRQVVSVTLAHSGELVNVRTSKDRVEMEVLDLPRGLIRRIEISRR